MIDIIKFKNVKLNGLTYGGHNGKKIGINLNNNENWFIKIPKDNDSSLSLKEYLGSHIYTSIGIETQETKLGIYENKLVVVCKDFLNFHEVIADYNQIKNHYNKKIEDGLKEIPHDNEIAKISLIMKHNLFFRLIPELKDRFWDMFIIDYFIGNNDRKDEDWGLVLNKLNLSSRIAPVYDNAASFHDGDYSVYNINPLKFIESMNNDDCNAALIRIVPKIDLNKIKEIFDDIPEEYNKITIFSKAQRDYYFKSLEYKYNNVLLPAYNKLINKCPNSVN